MRFLLRLAGLAIILWLHHPLLASPATADKATPLRERDRVAVQVIFSCGDSHPKTLQNGSTGHTTTVTAKLRRREGSRTTKS